MPRRNARDHEQADVGLSPRPAAPEGTALSRHRSLSRDPCDPAAGARRRALQQGTHCPRSFHSRRGRSESARRQGRHPVSRRVPAHRREIPQVAPPMAIWFKTYTLADILPLRRNTMVEHLGIEITEIGENYLRGTMPVDARTRQTMGLLHGGASVALAETLGSIAGSMVIDLSKQSCVGLEINANHLRAARSGVVTGTARP